MAVGTKRLRTDGKTFEDVVSSEGSLQAQPPLSGLDEGSLLKANADGTVSISSVTEDGSAIDFTGKELKNCPQLFSGGPMTLECGGGGDLSLISGTIGGDLKLSAPGGAIQVLSNVLMNGYSLSNLQNINAGGGTLSITNTGFPAVAIGGGIDLQNTGYIYRCASLYGENGLVLGTDNLGTVIQSGPFGNRQDEITILPGVITFGTPTVNVPTLILNDGKLQGANTIDTKSLTCNTFLTNTNSFSFTGLPYTAQLDAGGLTVNSTIQSNGTVKCLNLEALNLSRDPALGPGDLKVLDDVDLDQNIIKNASQVLADEVQSTSLRVNNKVIYVPENTMPSSYASNTTYIFIGSRTTLANVNLSGLDNICFKGLSRDTSKITFNCVGAGIFTDDANFSLVDLSLQQIDSSGLVLEAFNNPAKDKTLSITNCLIKDSYDFAEVSGYELVDISNTLFIHLKSAGPALQKCLQLYDVSKINISSCEFVKFYDILGGPASNLFQGPMIDIGGANSGAININNCIIHPRDNQIGVNVAAGLSFLEFCLIGNTFIDVGLTGGALLNTNSNGDWDTVAIAEGNSLLPNLKSRAGAQLSAVNANVTTLALNTPTNINIGSLLTLNNSFGVSAAPTGGITYLRKRPVNFQITFVANLVANTGGANQRVGLTVSVNGVNPLTNVSYVNLDSAGTDPKSVTLTLVGTATQGDVFRSQLINTSVGSDIVCRDLLISGIEI